MSKTQCSVPFTRSQSFHAMATAASYSTTVETCRTASSRVTVGGKQLSLSEGLWEERDSDALSRKDSYSNIMQALLSLLLLFTSTLLMSSTSAQASGPAPMCCTEFKGTRVASKLITDYYEQESPLCKIQAIIFVTVSGKRICSERSNPWAKRVMKCLDNKNKHRTLKN
ncbi:hypothetical protein DPEC_G00061120 [Dallia pectoralis]|uniref:Uncharacterized protein n=1 Tax=Dallia pectoralis TaxID=75939 RepID=A0ACC2H7I4_DALPE|nr:hypothetical protein DPEC_G00061120 [Dallia pectoralis]